MDREILRIVIIATGLIVIFGMILWSIFKNKNSNRFGRDRDVLRNIDPSLALHPERDEFDIVPLGSPLDYDQEGADFDYDESEYEDDPLRKYRQSAENVTRQKDKSQIPALIQLGLVAIGDDGFNGVDLANAFDDLNLKYGSIKIYERIDANGLVDFGVASMVEPGIFPDRDLEHFSSPGLVFFMQPREVEDPVAVFDDLMHSMDYLAAKLGGLKWDRHNQQLTDQAIADLRDSLW